MKKLNFGRFTTFGFCVAFLMLALAAHATAQKEERRMDVPEPQPSETVKTSIEKVKTFSGSAVIPYAGASLSRDKAGVFSTIYTSGLTPGTVVTFWWAIFNNARACATPSCAPPDLNNPDVKGSLQYGGGLVVGAEGRVDFGGYLEFGDNTGFYLLPQFPLMPNPAPGVVNTKGAVIHLVIRTHGAASPDPFILNQQLTTFPGGCSVTPNPCANIQAAQFVP